MSTTTTSDRLELFRLAYGDCTDADTRLLHFRMEDVRDIEEAATLLRMIDRYNGFSGSTVAHELAIPFPCLSSFTVGREYSPVVYATVPAWSHQCIGSGETWGEPLERETRDAIARGFLAAMERADASELSYVTPGGHVWYTPDGDVPANCIGLRAWWD